MKRFLMSLMVVSLPALAEETDLLVAQAAPAQPAAAQPVAAQPVAAQPVPAQPMAAAAAPARTRLVGVILSTSQALVWDEVRGEYALRRVGDAFEGGRIVALENDRLVVDRDGTRLDVEVAGAPIKAPVRRARRMPAVIIGQIAQPEAAGPVAATAPVAVAQPVAAAQPAVAAPAVAAPAVAAPAVAVAPAAPAVPAVAPAPVVVATPAVPAAPVPAAPVQPAPAPAVAAPAPVVVAAPQPREEEEVEATVIPRADLDRELGDFGSLSRQAQVTPSNGGGFQLVRVHPGSFVSRVGLRAGDVILRVDGRPINRIEDAAAAYAWLRVTDRFTVDVLREGTQMRLHYLIAPTSTRATR